MTDYFNNQQVRDLMEVKGQLFSNNYAPTLCSKLIGVYPKKGYCTYMDQRGRYESNKHIEPRRGVHKMPIGICWNAFFY
jgi:hypothetical protein